ncbi:MAG: type IV pilus twitching motility protein PilT [Huintestinicola sp.]
MYDIKEIMLDAVKQGASDIFIVAGSSVGYKVRGKVMHTGDSPLNAGDTENIVRQIFEIAGKKFPREEEFMHELDFSFSFAGVGRFRVNIYKQRGSLAAVMRYVLFELPDPSELHIPERIMELASASNGLVLITGSSGNGKSTTLTCLIDRINSTRCGHIVTIEDPIEFLHKHKKCIVSQREINIDTENYVGALRAALRQSPDILLLGEMRDYETMGIAMTAAETGQLVLSTLHTLGAVNTVDRIIDIFPTNQQHQIRMQLSMVLKAVVSQQLIPDVNGELYPAFEIMTVNNAIRTMIREQKTHQIETVMQTSPDMVTMDSAVFDLYKQGIITAENAVLHSSNPEMTEKKISLYERG